MPKLSIIIPVDELDEKGVECLDYLLNDVNKQTFRNCELIIVDDSRDKKISEYIGRYIANASIINYIIENEKNLINSEPIDKIKNIKKWMTDNKSVLVDIINKLETTKYLSEDPQEIEKYIVAISDIIASYLYNHFKNILVLPIVYKKIDKGNLAKKLNVGMRLAKGEIIQILGQNSYFVNNSSLQKIVDNFEPEKYWMVSPYWHTRDRAGLFRQQHPKLNPKLYCENTIGALSALTFLNKDIVQFNELLVCYVDCEYYYCLYLNYGMPKILKEMIGIQYIWDAKPNADSPTPQMEQWERQSIIETFELGLEMPTEVKIVGMDGLEMVK